MALLASAILPLLYVQFGYSLPSLNGTSVATLDIGDSPSNNNTRTLREIIWSCAATLFTCTWTAIHPSIPGMDEEKFAVILRRIGIMVIALIAPELMRPLHNFQVFITPQRPSIMPFMRNFFGNFNIRWKEQFTCERSACCRPQV